MFLEGHFKIKIYQVQYLHWNLTQQYTSFFLLYMYYALLEIYVEIKNILEIIQERLSFSSFIIEYLSLSIYNTINHWLCCRLVLNNGHNERSQQRGWLSLKLYLSSHPSLLCSTFLSPIFLPKSDNWLVFHAGCFSWRNKKGETQVNWLVFHQEWCSIWREEPCRGWS